MKDIKRLYLRVTKDLLCHLFFSSMAFGIIFITFHDLNLAVSAFLSGIFIDLDHWIDYFIVYKFSFKLKKFFISYQCVDSGKVYVFLHSWELVFLILIAGFFTGLTKFAAAVVLGMSLHLLVDQVLNFKKEPFFYFLTYRFMKNFNLKTLDKDFAEKWRIY